jgi:ABC-type antimicrobial peptide transport system permease subunit
MALEPGHGRSATPVRSTSVALALSVTAIVAGLVFAASMAHLTATPRLRGIDFEFATGFPFGDGVFEEVALPAILDDPGFSDLSVGNFQQLVDLRGPSGESMEVSAWAVEPVRGEGVTTTMTEGRWPNATDEIALGAKTLDQLGTELGGIITLEVGDERRDVEVVGITVFPDFGFGPGLGEGAGISMDTLRELYPDSSHIELAAGNYAPGVVPADVLDRLNPTLRKIDAAVSEADIGAMGNTLSDASRYERIPLYAAACFVVAALVTLAHLLLTSARTRRRDLAVLRTLGFRGRQLMATVAWQAVTLVAVGFAIGAPAGILVGRFVWNALAEALGVIAVPVVPVTTVVILAPALALAALTVALGPATVARRAKPAQVLRAE